MITGTAGQQVKKVRLVPTFSSRDTLMAAQAPQWFYAMRHAAAQRYNQLGLPTSRHEDWRFTNIASIRETAFELPTSVDSGLVAAKQVESVGILGLDGPRLVFVNGRFDSNLSSLGTMPKGVEVLSLAQAFTSRQALLEKHLGTLAGVQDQAFTALNTALADDGVVVFVSKGCSAVQPIYILNITVADKPLMTNSRNLIVVEANAAATVIEDYASPREDVYLTNAVTEVVVGDNADVTHYLIERESHKAFNVSSLYVRQGRDSRFTSHSILFGGAIVRNNIYPVLDGQGCDSLLNGLYVIGGDQIADSHMRVEHTKPHCDSRQFYKGIMTDRASGVFRGRIVVRQDAQKTDAKQSNENLLLSDDASANTDPQLEIYADDVKCTHGATIGQIDEDQVFFLRSRGIPKQTAQALIVYAFASESLERMEVEPVRGFLRSQLLDRLPAGAVLKRLL